MPLFGKFFSEAQMKAAIEQYRLSSLMPPVPCSQVLATAGRAATIEEAKGSVGGLSGYLELWKEFAEACDSHRLQNNLVSLSRTDGKGGWKGADLVPTAHLYCLRQHALYGINCAADGPLYVTAERRGLLAEIGDVGSPRWDAVAKTLAYGAASMSDTMHVALDDYFAMFSLRVSLILQYADPESPFPQFIRPELSGDSVPSPSHCPCGCSTGT